MCQDYGVVVVVVETVVVVVVGWTCVVVVGIAVLELELEYHQMPPIMTMRIMIIHHTFAEP